MTLFFLILLERARHSISSLIQISHQANYHQWLIRNHGKGIDEVSSPQFLPFMKTFLRWFFLASSDISC
jgi:hypothetical protein